MDFREPRLVPFRRRVVAGATGQFQGGLVPGVGVGGFLRGAAAVIPLVIGGPGVGVAFVKPVVVEIEALAASAGITASQLAIAWVLAQGQDIVPIPGTKRRSYLDQNAAAVDLDLSKALLEELSNTFPPDTAAGDRYAPAVMAYVNG